ncbi:MAG: GNAT family N-acetyltransferase [Methanomicrobiaceae archaeon]|uniref:N-acetyltransferase domain-containing protein n=1 Tax=hydrocarbon metagenome TaxID=938273 RepID=A0A0W8FIS9_9ZZZZ|nr:GNAT family N-acetyltransferase [Methanomicrobiaceae archaeon]MDD5419764.1 GNAT family N-acetyltransferase [Methanomicrobiaceae archaeon]
MRTEYIDAVSPGRWESIVRESKQAYFFHTPAWARILEEAYGYRNATRLYEVDGSDVLIPMMEKERYGLITYYSMPEGYGNVFSPSGVSQETLQTIITTIVGGRNLLLMLFLPPCSRFKFLEDTSVQRIELRENRAHIIPLEEGVDAVRKRFNRNTRRSIARAGKERVEVVPTNRKSDFDTFYSLYAQRSQEWNLSETPYPRRFFESLYAHGSPHARLRLAERDGEAIGGIITLEYGTNVYYLASASPRACRAYCANHLLLQDAIESACMHGYRFFDLGCSTLNPGLARFKEGFGAEEIPLERYGVFSGLERLYRGLGRAFRVVLDEGNRRYSVRHQSATPGAPLQAEREPQPDQSFMPGP